MSLDAIEVKNGAILAHKGLKAALSRPKILRYFYKSFLFISVSLTIIYILSNFLVYVPLYIIRFINKLFGFLFRYSTTSFDGHIDSAVGYINNNLKAIPLTCVYLFRYVYPYPMNNIFLVSVQALSTPHYEILSQRQYQLNYWGELIDSIKRTGKRLKNIVFILILSKVPVIGVFALPIATFYLTSRSIGVKLSLAIAVFPLAFPGTKSFIIWGLRGLYATRVLSRELLEPYFGRVKMNGKSRAKFFKGKDSLLLGFSFGYCLLITYIPVIGPVFYVLAQSAIATFLVEKIPVQELIPSSSIQPEVKDKTSEVKPDLSSEQNTPAVHSNPSSFPKEK